MARSRSRPELDTPYPLWEHDLGKRAGLAASLLPLAPRDKDGRTALLGGVDEAGRGPLAGKVVAACVILPLGEAPIPGIDDSKKLRPEKREELYETITRKALGFGLGESSPAEIDRLNILQATFLAMKRALAALRPAGLKPDLVLVDGNRPIPGLGLSQTCLVKGDGKSASIAAASILAKVTRDRQLEALDRLYPQYGFARHKGYPTAAHREALRRHGPCPEHRRSFLGFLAEA